MFNLDTTNTAPLPSITGENTSPVIGMNGNILESPQQPVPLALYSPTVDEAIIANMKQTIYGTRADDLLRGDVGKDILKGRQGHDQLLGGAGDDRLLGGRGKDYLHGGDGHDVLLGGQGRDQLIGGSGDDVLRGQRGNDRLFGQAGRDRLFGGQGHDQLNGGTGRDVLRGGRGNDRLVDADGGDRLLGGAGADTFWIGDGSQGMTQVHDFKVGRDRLKFMTLGITYEGLTFKQRGHHTVIAFQGKNLAKLKNTQADTLQPDSFEFGDASLIEQLQNTLETSLAPGAAMAVVTADGSVWQGAAGLADIDAGTPMPTNAQIDIGSITKPIVAVTTLQLMQEGKLTLDDTLGQWLPEVIGNIENSETITLRQLLNHSSGIPDIYDDDFALSVLADLDRIWTPEDFIESVYGKQSDFSPGERFRYSNTNYTLLGLVIQAVTGDGLESQVRSRIFTPLGMDDSLMVSPSTQPDDFLRGYFDPANYGLSEESQLLKVPFHPSLQGFGEGGIVSSVADLARFSEALNNGELLSPTTYQQMQAESVGGEDDITRTGLGIDVVSTDYGTLIGHDGGFPGAAAAMYALQGENISVMTLENRTVSSEQLLGDTLSTLLISALAEQ
ncbi:MAG: serine hydrolase [Cyanobacteria bacterium J06598_3]